MTADSLETTLEDIRRDIDTIDDGLLDLLLQRASATLRVRTAKTAEGSMQSSPFRPAREAQMLRRLLASAGNRVPSEALVRLWRVILSASVQSQSTVSIHVDGLTSKDLDMRIVIASHFCGMTVVEHKTAENALAAVQQSNLDLAVFRTDTDWADGIAAAQNGRAAIIGSLPTLASDGVPQLLIAGTIQPQASGDDQTIVLTKTSLTGALLPAANWQIKSGIWVATSLAGFHDSDCAMFSTIRERNPGQVLRVAGQLPSPLSVQS